MVHDVRCRRPAVNPAAQVGRAVTLFFEEAEAVRGVEIDVRQLQPDTPLGEDSVGIASTWCRLGADDDDVAHLLGVTRSAVFLDHPDVAGVDLLDRVVIVGAAQGAGVGSEDFVLEGMDRLRVGVAFEQFDVMRSLVGRERDDPALSERQGIVVDRQSAEAEVLAFHDRDARVVWVQIISTPSATISIS